MKLQPGDLYEIDVKPIDDSIDDSMGISTTSALFLFYPSEDLTDVTQNFTLPKKDIGMYIQEKTYTDNKKRIVLCFLFGNDVFYIEKGDFMSAIENNQIAKLCY